MIHLVIFIIPRRDNGLAEKVFNSMEPKTAEAYCALVCGMANHGQVEGAHLYFHQMMDKGLVPSVDAFNAIIKAGGSLKESAELKWNFIQDMLTSMAAAKVRPTVLTLNACLETVSSIAINRLAREVTSKLLAEFRAAGIAPSLATYFHVLRIFCRESNFFNFVFTSFAIELIFILNRGANQQRPD